MGLSTPITAAHLLGLLPEDIWLTCFVSQSESYHLQHSAGLLRTHTHGRYGMCCDLQKKSCRRASIKFQSHAAVVVATLIPSFSFYYRPLLPCHSTSLCLGHMEKPRRSRHKSFTNTSTLPSPSTPSRSSRSSRDRQIGPISPPKYPVQQSQDRYDKPRLTRRPRVLPRAPKEPNVDDYSDWNEFPLLAYNPTASNVNKRMQAPQSVWEDGAVAQYLISGSPSHCLQTMQPAKSPSSSSKAVPQPQSSYTPGHTTQSEAFNRYNVNNPTQGPRTVYWEPEINGKTSHVASYRNTMQPAKSRSSSSKAIPQPQSSYRPGNTTFSGLAEQSNPRHELPKTPCVMTRLHDTLVNAFSAPHKRRGDHKRRR